MVNYPVQTVPGQASQRQVTSTLLSAHPFNINHDNWQMLLLNQRKRKNGRRNIFMTKSSRKDVPDAKIDRGVS